MIEVSPGDTFTADATGYPDSLVGTIGVTIKTLSGTIVTARSTAGITEDATGDHGNPKYTATLTAPAAGNYLIQFDDGAGVYSEPDDLLVDFESTLPSNSFASVDDLEARLRQVFTEEERAYADTLLRFTTGLIQDAADGQTIFLVTDDTLTLTGRNDERVLLPQRPVVSVASVTIAGEPLIGGSDWYLDNDALVRIGTPNASQWALDYMASARTPGFGYPYQTLEIVYTHGYAQVPEMFRTICMEAVVRVWVNPGSVVQSTIGDEQTTYAPYSAPPRGLMLTDSELRAIRKKKGARARGMWIG